MPTFALLKNVSFKFKNTFDCLSVNVFKEYLNDKVEYIDFVNTSDLFIKLNSIFLNAGNIDVVNCNYDKFHLSQGFCFDNGVDDFYHNFVIVKRKINENDSYTYLHFDDKLPDPYEYVDITYDDIVSILRNKHVYTGVMIYSSGEIRNTEYINIYDNNTHCGKLILENAQEISYFNMASHFNASDECSDVLSEKINNSNAKYLYTQKNIEICLLNCYSQTEGFVKNEIVSKLFNGDVYGDVFLGLENYLNDDVRLLKLDNLLFEKIMHISSSFKQKNSLFFNVYYELL